MKQALHIFRKDVVHLWPELGIYAALLMVSAWIVPHTRGAPAGELAQVLSRLLESLIPILWFVLTVRLVQDESLVGDRQFWITRPYPWASLLAAKVGFVVVCVVLPFVVMQWWLVLRAGLSPLASLPGLLLSLPSYVQFNWLLFFAVAAVTASLSRAFMAVVGLLIAWVLILFGADTAGPLMTPPYASAGISILVVCLVVGILIYQYAFRNTALSRLALVATLLLALGLFGCFLANFFAAPLNALVRHHYPMSANAGLHLSFDSRPLAYRNQMPKKEVYSGGFLTLQLPMQLQGLDTASRVHEPNAAFTIDAHGYHYESPWRPVTVDDRGLYLLIPAEIFNRVHAGDVRMHLSFAAERLQP